MVSMLWLVRALQVAEMCGGGMAGVRTFGDAGDGGGVVRAIRDDGVGNIVVVRHDHDLSEEAAVLEGAVGDDVCMFLPPALVHSPL